LSSTIAAHINYFFRGDLQYLLYHHRMHTISRRVGNNYIRSTVLCNEFGGENLFHISNKKRDIVYAIDDCVFLSSTNSLWNGFNSYYLFYRTCNKLCDGSGTGIEIINQFISRKVSKITGYLI